MALLIALALPAGAWTNPVAISPSGDTETSIPRIARGSGGKMLVAYRRKFPDWRLFYRERSGAGVWGPVETVTVPWSERPDIIEDPLGRPHMFYAATGAGGKTDLFEATKSGATWTITQFTNTDTIGEDYARLATDSLGRIHLVYTKNTDVYYRVWNGAWSGETYLGHCETTYYHRPDMSVDSANCVHVTWEDSTHLYYRKFNGSTWLPQQVIGTGANFFSYGKVAAISASSIVAVTFDQLSSAVLKWTCSADGGSTWSALQYLNDGHYPNLDAWGGSAYLVYEWAGGRSIGYRKWNGSTWTAAEHVTLDAAWQGWPDVAADTSGVVHVVLDDNSSHIDYVNSNPDTVPPQPVTGLTATEGDRSVQLTWTNPSDLDFQGTMIRVKVGGYPNDPGDGDLVGDFAALPGSTGSCTHTDLANGTTYYYRAFAHDSIPNYSAPAQITAKPHAISCLQAKQLDDATWVSLGGKVVTLVSVYQGFIYVQETDRSSGMGVSVNPTGLAVGDTVDLTGTMATRVLSGVNAERVLSATGFSKTGTFSPKPLGMKCLSVGGGPAGLLIPGVVGGKGLNNMGLLVRIVGKVKAKVNDSIWVDDGSKIDDPSGKTGVLVKCPDSSIPASVGDMMSAVGVVEGSIPIGYPGNRRQIRIRAYADLRVFQ